MIQGPKNHGKNPWMTWIYTFYLIQPVSLNLRMWLPIRAVFKTLVGWLVDIGDEILTQLYGK